MSRKETSYIGCKTARRKPLLVAHAQPACSAISFPNDAAVAGFCPTRAPLLLLRALVRLPLPDREPQHLTSPHMRVIPALQASFFFFSYSYFLTPTASPVGWFSSVYVRVRKALCPVPVV